MVTKDEAFLQYKEELERIAQQARTARNYARIVLREQLKALQVEHHQELKFIRVLEQKTKRSK